VAPALRPAYFQTPFQRRKFVTNVEAEWLLSVDGAARGNPGDAGCGAAISDVSGAVVQELSRYLGKTTNNVAEYEALLMGLEALIAMGKKKIRVQSDSELLVRQLNGQYRVRDPKLKMLFERARSLLRHFDRCTIVHVRREANKLADKLANRGIDDALKKRRAG
jgi:ribonuclease HI